MIWRFDMQHPVNVVDTMMTSVFMMFAMGGIAFVLFFIGYLSLPLAASR